MLLRFRVFNAILFSLILSSCASVQYTDTIQEPSSSINSVSPIGFGPFYNLLESFSKERHVYLTPYIPASYEKKFRDCHGSILQSEEIYAFINEDAFASGCHGIVFTSKGIHSNAVFIGTKFFIPYSKLYSRETNFDTAFNAITVNSTHMYFHPDLDENKVYSLFREARRRPTNPKYQSFTYK